MPKNIRRVLRKSTLVEGTIHDMAFQKFLRWMAENHLIHVEDLPIFPGTQTMTPGAAPKFDYYGAWKLRATVNGGIHLHPNKNSRADYIDRRQISYFQTPIVKMIAFILKHNSKFATITDYKKFFLYIKHLEFDFKSNSHLTAYTTEENFGIFSENILGPVAPLFLQTASQIYYKKFNNFGAIN